MKTRENEGRILMKQEKMEVSVRIQSYEVIAKEGKLDKEK